VRRAFGDALISVAALVILLAVLVAVDGRVRDQVVGMVSHDAWSSDASRVQAQLRSVTSVILRTAKDQSIDHAPLVVFVVAGTALVLAMLRL